MNLSNYRRENPFDEVLTYFPGSFALAELYYPQSGQRIAVKRPQPGSEIHHLTGALGRRRNVLSNVVRVCNATHVWLETHKRAGLVLCLWHKREKGELDWAELEGLTRKRFPGCLDVDAYRECCALFPWIEQMRRELLSGAS